MKPHHILTFLLTHNDLTFHFPKKKSRSHHSGLLHGLWLSFHLLSSRHFYLLAVPRTYWPYLCVSQAFSFSLGLSLFHCDSLFSNLSPSLSIGYFSHPSEAIAHYVCLTLSILPDSLHHYHCSHSSHFLIFFSFFNIYYPLQNLLTFIVYC